MEKDERRAAFEEIRMQGLKRLFGSEQVFKRKLFRQEQLSFINWPLADTSIEKKNKQSLSVKGKPPEVHTSPTCMYDFVQYYCPKDKSTKKQTLLGNVHYQRKCQVSRK